MRSLTSTLAILLLVAAPVAAMELPAMPPPNLTPEQMSALKKGLDASPQTPGRQAMMAKLLKLALAIKKKQPISPTEVLPLLAYLRESNAGKKLDPAFEGALGQLEDNVAKMQHLNNTEDMNELRKEFEGWGGTLDPKDLE